MELQLNYFYFLERAFYYLSDEQGLVYIGIMNQLSRDRKRYFRGFSINFSNKKEYFQYFKAYFNHENILHIPQHFFYGTLRQRQIWQSLSMIPWGKTVSYQTLAKKAKQGNAVRAVAHAVAQNPLLLLRPCHRVILKNGNVGQYRCGVNFKHQLLTFESN